MSKWTTLLTNQKTYEITKLSPGMEYTVSINGTYNSPIEVWLTTLVEDENGIVEIEINQNSAVYVGDLEYNKLTFTAQNLYTALVIRSLGDLELTTIQLELGSTPTEYSLAPEDGYGLDLPNGAYHIQGTEGYTTADFLNTVSGVKVHNWSETSINGTQLPLNETYDFEGVDKIDFAGNNLDFIASNPSITIVDDPAINFPNKDYMIPSDVYINTDSTYRQVLDDICNLTGSTMSIKDNKLYLHQLNDTGLTLSQNLAKSMEIGEKIGKFNVLNLAREPQGDNYPYPLDFTNIPEKDRVEFVIANNPIIDNDRETLAPLIFPLINNFDYYTFNHNAQGYGIFNVGDIVTLEDLKGNKYKSIVTDETSTFKQMNLSETESKVLSNLKPEYAKPNQLQKLGREMYFIVDQQNGIIEGLINEVDEVKDETARLTIEVDKIETKVENVHLGNIIPNANGESQYAGWSGTGILLGVSDLIGYPDLTSTMTAIPKFIAGSLSEFGWEFFTSGQMISTFGYISGLTYSFKAKIGNFKPCIITVYEYKADKSANGTIVKQFNNPQSYIQFTDNLKNDTVYVKLGIEFPTATPSSRPNISEIMYNKGEPKDWFETPLDAIMFAESSRRQLSNRITDTVTEIDKVSGDIHNTTVDITARDGVVIKNNNGKGLTILNDNDEEVISLNANGDIISLKMTAIDMVTKNMIANNINAVSGDIGKFHLENGTLVYTTPEYNRPYTQADLSDIVAILKGFKTANAYENYIYDINNDGNITVSDMAMIKVYLDGDTGLINKPIKSRVIIGTLDGKITTQVLYGADDTVGASFTMQAERLSGMLVDTQALATNSMLFNGQEVYNDNGTLKVRNL